MYKLHLQHGLYFKAAASKHSFVSAADLHLNIKMAEKAMRCMIIKLSRISFYTNHK